jgi:hypothetical protein
VARDDGERRRLVAAHHVVVEPSALVLDFGELGVGAGLGVGRVIRQAVVVVADAKEGRVDGEQPAERRHQRVGDGPDELVVHQRAVARWRSRTTSRTRGISSRP